jgi:acetylglutamate kinase
MVYGKDMREDFAGRIFVLRVDGTDIGSSQGTLVADLAFLAEHHVRPIIVAPNKAVASNWVRTLNRNANVAVGLSGADAALLPAARRDHIGTVQTRILATLTGAGYVPVIEPTAFALSGDEIAVGADEVAGAIASATDAARAIFFHEAGGVTDPQTQAFLSELTPAEALTLAEHTDLDVTLRAAMRAAAHGVRGGVAAAQIVDGRIAHATIVELLTTQHLGTQVTGSILFAA